MVSHKLGASPRAGQGNFRMSELACDRTQAVLDGVAFYVYPLNAQGEIESPDSIVRRVSVALADKIASQGLLSGIPHKKCTVLRLALFVRLVTASLVVTSRQKHSPRLLLLTFPPIKTDTLY
eukprot:scaffold343379_cov39-Prasinocladus_malaysianus.AAC.1